jgi:hypothetical protein
LPLAFTGLALLLEPAAPEETVLGDLQTALTLPAEEEPLELLPEAEDPPEPPDPQAARLRTAVALSAAMDSVDVRMRSHLSRGEFDRTPVGGRLGFGRQHIPPVDLGVLRVTNL